VIIYKSTTNDTVVPALCMSTTPSASGAGVSGSCNVYTLSQLQAAVLGGGSFTATCTSSAGTAWDHWWCPTDRKADLISVPDWAGMYVQANYTYLTKLFGSATRTISDRAVFREEVSLG
jgi:hypothetical protein